jgi:hypothetical protein
MPSSAHVRVQLYPQGASERHSAHAEHYFGSPEVRSCSVS